MKSGIEKIYNQLPVALQNVLLSVYGLYIQRIRHGHQYRDFLRQIKNHLTLSIEEREKIQWKVFRQLLTDSRKYVPYYRVILKDISIQNVKCIDDMLKFPLLEKKVLRTSPETLIDERYKKKKLLIVRTTGTTGTPLNIYCTSQVRKKNYAFYNRFLLLAGIQYSDKRATFGGRIVVAHDQQRPPFWRYSYFQKNLLFSSFHLRDETIESYIEKLFQYRPHYIDSYPSSIYTIAKYAQEHAINLKGITVGITTSAETLFDDQRVMIEEAFGVPVIDQYGATEMCVFIGQCAQGRYHVHTDYAIVEFLREDGSQAMAGEEAEVVCTGLINPVMPLIRYKIGDKVVVSDEQCTCGCVFPVVGKLIGRADDVILTPEGNRVGRLGSVLKGFPVKEAQYLQETIHAVTVRLVPDDRYSADTEQKLVVELRKRLGQEIEIHIQQVQRIDRGTGGKLKTVSSALTQCRVS
jgi:phenylacetate-CoA ligase